MHPYASYGIHFITAAHAALGGAFFAVVILFVAIELLLSGFALWYSARNRQYVWFIIFLLVHTLGILEAIYLIWFRNDKNSAARVSPPPAAPPASVPPSSSAA